MTDAPDKTSKDHASTAETHHGEAAAPDDIREQMRLALERKNNKNGSAGGRGGGPSGAKASAATENSKHQREFRRKSGG